jgi:Tfp pilus assembly protein FimT
MDRLETTMTLATGQANNTRHRAGAFTLIELILVMALLVIVVSLISPTLSRFFRGRKVDLEVRRVSSLIHLGRSRAASEGVPIMLWVDPNKGEYGLKQQPGYSDTDSNAVDFAVADGLKMGTDKRSVVNATPANSQTGRILNGQVAQSKNTLSAIYFLPDGSINDALSISGISIQEGDSPPVWIVSTASQSNYEVQSQNEHLAASRR